MSLDAVYAEIAEDPYWDHLRLPGVKLVRGYGAMRPQAMLVGEAPGATENARGRPFCGPSGRILNGLMDLAGLSLDDVHIRPCAIADGYDPFICTSGCRRANAYVTNTVKYRPPSNRTPGVGEILHAQESLRKEWAALGGPGLVIAVGGVAHSAVHPVGYESVSRWVGKPVFKDLPSGRRVWAVSQFHPAYGLRDVKHRPGMERSWEEMGNWMREEGLL